MDFNLLLAYFHFMNYKTEFDLATGPLEFPFFAVVIVGVGLFVNQMAHGNYSKTFQFPLSHCKNAEKTA